jgi:hypothetical protein
MFDRACSEIAFSLSLVFCRKANELVGGIPLSFVRACPMSLLVINRALHYMSRELVD